MPVLDTQAGKGALTADHPLCIGGVGSTGNNAANELAAEADVLVEAAREASGRASESDDASVIVAS